MSPVSFVALHGGSGVEPTLLEYLYRVLLHLLAVGGVAVLVHRWLDAVETVRSALVARRDGEADER